MVTRLLCRLRGHPVQWERLDPPQQRSHKLYGPWTAMYGGRCRCGHMLRFRSHAP